MKISPRPENNPPEVLRLEPQNDLEAMNYTTDQRSDGPNMSDHGEEHLVELSEAEVHCIRSFVVEKNFGFQILDIKKVKNNFLEVFYELKKAEIRSRFKKPPEELFLIHVTSANHVKNIVKDNFDWRRITRGKFGMGTSFTDDAQYAHRYANYNIGDNRALIICKVLVSRSTRGHKDQSQLAPTFDTSIGNNNKVYVKFCDNEMLPLYVIYYHGSSREVPLSNINQLVRPQSSSLARQSPISLLSNDQQTLRNINKLLKHQPLCSQSSTVGRQSSHPLSINVQPPVERPRHVREPAVHRPSQSSSSYVPSSTIRQSSRSISINVQPPDEDVLETWSVHRPSQSSISYISSSTIGQNQYNPQIIVQPPEVQPGNGDRAEDGSNYTKFLTEIKLVVVIVATIFIFYLCWYYPVLFNIMTSQL